MPGNYPALFGFPAGQSQAAEDQYKTSLTAEALARTAEVPSEIRVKQATAAHLEIENAREQQFNRLLSQANGLPTTTPGGSETRLADTMDNLALLATSAGMIDKGGQLAARAATIRLKQAQTENAYNLADKNAAIAAKQNADLIGQLLGDVKDQQSWDRALAMWTFQTGRPSKYAGLPYSPELVKRLQDNALSVKEKADLHIKEADERSKEQARKDREAEAKRRNDILERGVKVREEHEQRLAKGGGGKSLTISANERTAAAALIKKDYPELGNDKSLNELFVASNTIASTAKQLMSKNAALSWSEALNQAYATERPNFKSTNPTFGSKTTRFTAGGRTAETAIPITPDVPASERVYDRWYINPAGVRAKWTKEGWDTGNASGLSVDNANEDDEEEEEE